jgi:hypothetical protein
MKVRKFSLFLALLLLTLASFAPVAGATPGPIPIPTPPPARLAKADLMFVSAGCTRSNNGGRLIVFTVRNDTLMGFGFASGNFKIAVNGNLMPTGQNSLAPQETRTHTVNVANPGWYNLDLDPDHQVEEANEVNNFRRVWCS